MEVIWIMMCL